MRGASELGSQPTESASAEVTSHYPTARLPAAPGNINLLTENRKPETEQPSGCLLCGAPLHYVLEETPAHCVYCHTEQTTNVRCQQGHFVCDACHSRDALAVIEHLLTTTRETDMLALLEEIRNHPAVPRHGPEHHSLVPGIILAAYRNSGGPVTPAMLQTALRRGKSIAGGACAYLGVCGAAAGVGAAFSLLLDANPVKPQERQAIKQITLAALQASAHPDRGPLLPARVLAGPAPGRPDFRAVSPCDPEGGGASELPAMAAEPGMPGSRLSPVARTPLMSNSWRAPLSNHIWIVLAGSERLFRGQRAKF